MFNERYRNNNFIKEMKMDEINYDALSKEYGTVNIQRRKAYELKKEQL